MERLLDSLKAWCSQKYGRQTEVAEILGVTPQSVNDWFGGRKQLTGEQVLAVQQFLGRQQLLKTQGKSAKKGQAAQRGRKV
jgi:DNA-binding transcriptional regulator YdaS (Cro superfamily)